MYLPYKMAMALQVVNVIVTLCMVLKPTAAVCATCHILQLQRRCATQTEKAYSLGRSPSPSRTLSCSHTAALSPSLPYNGLHPRNPCNFMHYHPFTDPRRMEGWVGWPKLDSLPTKCRLSTIDRAQDIKSLSAKDRRPNHWFALPANVGV